MEEFEIKFLEVNVPELEKKLFKIGAKKVGEFNYHRHNFDYPDRSLHKNYGWVRLRTDGKETTLAYKAVIKNERDNKNIGAKEIEVKVDDYEKAHKFLKAIGLVPEQEERNKRIRYVKDDVVFDVDSWPFLPVYLEIESDSHKKAEQAAQELGFDPKDGIIGSAGSIYKKYGYDIHDYSSITFEGMVKK